MANVVYRGKSITFPEGMSEDEISQAMPSIADQIDADFSSQEAFKVTPEKSKSFSDRVINTAKDAADYIKDNALRLPLAIADELRTKSVVDGMDGKEVKPDQSAAKSFKKAIDKSKKQNVLEEGAEVVDGISGVAKVGLNRGYAGLGKIEAGFLKSVADLTNSETLAKLAEGQNRYADKVENRAVLRGKPVEGFAKESIVQDLPEAGANAISSVIQTAPALGVGAASGGSALPALFGGVALQEYNEGREKDLSPLQSATRAIPMAGAEVVGEKLGGFEKIAKGLRKATQGNGVADLGAAMLESSLKELPAEELTTTLQFLIDKTPEIGLNQDATFDDYKKAVKDTALATILQSGGMGAGGAVLTNIAKKLDAPVGTPEADEVNAQLLAAFNASQQQKQDQAKQAEADTALANITNPDASIDDAIALAEKAIDIPVIKPNGLLNTISAQEAIPASDILGDDNVSADVLGTTGIVDSGTIANELDNAAGSAVATREGINADGPSINREGAASDTPAGTGSQPDDALIEPDYSTMSYEQLQQAREDGMAKNKQLDLSVIRKYAGDDIANEAINWPQRKIDKWFESNATGEMENESSAFKGVNVEKIDQYANAITNFDESTPKALGNSIALKMRDIDKPGFEGSPEFVSIKNALAYSKEQGWNESEVIEAMRDKAVEYAGRDAPELFERLFKIKPQQQNEPQNIPETPLASQRAQVQVAGRKIDKEWTAFTPESGTLNIPRSEMPQVKAEHRGAMVNFLNARGVDHTQETVPASSLKPTQQEFSEAKVKKASKYAGGDRSILVSSDNHVLDGHHQWLSKLNKGDNVDVIRLNAPIAQLLNDVKEFPSSTVESGAISSENVKSENTAPAVAKQSKQKTPKQYKPKTLLATLRELGGVSLSEKRDVTGEHKGFAPGGYNQIFKKDNNRSLKGLIESGDLDDYLPYNMRLESNGANDDAFDSTEAYDYLADKIRNGESVLPYDTQQEIEASQFYQNESAQDDIGSIAEISDEEVNKLLQEAGYDERENGTESAYYGSGLDEQEQESAGSNSEIENVEQGRTNSDVASGEREESAAETNAGKQAEVGTAKQDTDLLGENTTAKQAIADAERAKDAKRNSGNDNQDTFTLTGSNSEADQAAAAGAQDLFAVPKAETQAEQSNNDVKSLEARLEKEIAKRTDMQTKHMEKYRNGSATRAQTTTYNANVGRVNDTINEIRAKLKDLKAQLTTEASTGADVAVNTTNQSSSDQAIDEVSRAKAALDQANITGAERLDVVAKVRAGGLTADDVVEAHGGQDKEITPLSLYDNAMDDYENGVANVDDYKKAFDYVLTNEKAIKDYLEANFTKQQLFDRAGGYLESRYKSEKKIRVVGAFYSDMVSSFLLPSESGMTSYSVGFGDDRYKGIKSQVDAITQDSLNKAMERRKQVIEKNEEARAERLKGIDNPQSLEDYTNLLRTKMAEGMSLKDARLSLTPDQRETYDSLYADKTIADRAGRKEANRSDIRTAGQNVQGSIIETKHTKKLTDLFVVQLSERVSKEDYNTLNTGAKNLGGYYSSFRGAGAVPGFQFTAREHAEAFVKLAGGDNTAANEQAKERRDAFADDRSQSAVERLSEMADRLEEKADEELGRERKANTSRRAGMAARAEANASAQKAMAITMRNIAQAIESGKAKYLGKVRQKVQVELLQSLTSAAQYTKLRAQYPAYSEYEKHQHEAPTKETADYSEFPTYTLYRSDLASLGRAMSEVDGLKTLGSRILSVADDVTDAYLKFAKDNIDKVSRFTTSNGERAVFTSKSLAEEAIVRSGFRGKAIVLPFKRGQNIIIDSPSASKERGDWVGDDDKKITLSADLGRDIVEKIGKANRKANKLNMPWQFENAYDKREKLARMGIENPAEMRAVIREFISLKEEAKQPDKIKELERKMVGRRNDGLDFFPTPASTADEMIEAADIQEGMNVLEPSAGMGHIAERIRDAGFESDVVEFSGDRRELLELKGFNVVGSDFLDVTEKYDRIIMNPPFSDRRDEEHVRHAYNLLKPNGKLVAIMGEGVFFGSDKRATEFRDWLDAVGGTSEKLEEGTFKDASLPVNTGVNARMVVIEKQESDSGNVVMFSRSNNSQTETEAFKAWFGNSKVVDAEGKPLVVYHGTRRQFNAFEALQPIAAPGNPKGIYFTSDKREAEEYAADTYGDMDDKSRVVEAYLKIESDADGIIKKRNVRGEDVFEYIVFDPKNIKSATDNSGNFDPNNNDIRFSHSNTNSIPYRGMDKDKAQSIIDELQKSHKGIPKVKLVDHHSKLPIPSSIIEEINGSEQLLRERLELVTQLPSEQNIQAALSVRINDVEGLYSNGEIWINTNAINSEERLREVFAHEAIGHMSVASMLNEVDKTLLPKLLTQVKTLNKAGNKYIRGIWDDVKESQPDIDDNAMAGEVLAFIAERGDQDVEMSPVARSIWQRLIDGIKAFAKLVFDVEMTDVDVRDIVSMASRYAKGEDVVSLISNKDMYYSRNNRVPSKADGDTFLTAALEFTARNEDFFENAPSDAKEIADIASDMNTQFRVEPFGKSQTKLDGADTAWEVFLPNAKYRSAVIYEKGNEVWINVSRLRSGADFGNRIYSLAAAYAYNNDKVFIGDPLGLTAKAFYRRAENMLSSALKYGTTKHIEPHVAQTDPDLYYSFDEKTKDFGEAVRKIDWKKGNDAHNIKELIYTVYHGAITNLPELKNVIFNPTTQGFTTISGEQFTDDDFERVLSNYYARTDSVSGSRVIDGSSQDATVNTTETSNPYRAGIRTAKRAAFYNTFLRKQSSEERTELLGSYVRELQNRGLAPALQGVMYSRSTQSPQASLTTQWQVDESSKMDNVIRALQDKYIDLKRVTQEIKKAGTDIADRWNAYLQEELYHGRSAKRVQDFIKQDLTPLIEDMRMRGVGMADFEEYLWMRHAPERNKQIATINPDMQDGGAGVTTAEANSYMAALDPADKRKYEALAKRIDAITAKSRQVLVDYGLESQSTVNAWQSAYQFYVPLMREDMERGTGNGTGSGFKVKGNSSKRAMGSNRAVVDVIANIAQQYEKNVVRGEKNRVATAMIGLAKLNPNEEFWNVETPPTIRHVSKATGLVETRTDPSYKNRNNVIVARIVNKRGEIEERSVTFNEFNDRAMKMALSLNNLDVDQVSAVSNFMGNITRYFSSINTQYNPIFGIVNITRDTQGAMLNLSTTEIAGKQKEVLANIMPALRGIYAETRTDNGIKSPMQFGSFTEAQKSKAQEMRALWEEYQREGGATGFRYMYANAEERTKAVSKALDHNWWTKTLAGKVVTVGGVLTVPETALNDKLIKPIFHWLSDYNQTLENAVRLAAYKVAIDQGLSKQQAASLGKNLTVNFNRKGTATRTMGSWYAFFNAAVQGTARIGETLTGPKGKQIIAGGISIGVAQAVMLAAMGFDEDEPQEFLRSTNFIIPAPGTDKGYVTIPMPLGFNVLPNFGRITTEWLLSGAENTTERVFDIFGAVMESFNPLGGNGRIDSIIMPTVADPFNDLSKNEDWTGRNIAQEDFSNLRPTPGYTRTRDKATELSIELARWINNLSGGDDYEKGQLSPTGDQIEYLTGQLTGGVGREVVKTVNTIESIVTGEDLPTYKIPLVGRFVGNSAGQAPQAGKFYNNLIKLNKLEAGYLGRLKDGKDADKFLNENQELNYVDYGKKAQSAISKLRDYKRDLVKEGANREEVKLVDEQITLIMTEFNQTVKPEITNP